MTAPPIGRSLMPEQPSDLIVPPVPGVENWSENLFFLPYDHAKQVGAAMHMGRSAQDPGIWREYLHVFLPGGRVLAAKVFGRRQDESERLAGANGLSYECLEEFKRWRIRFDGVARDTTMDALLAGPLTDGVAVRLRIDLAAECLFEPWSAKTSAPAAAAQQEGSDGATKVISGGLAGGAREHYEQVCRYRGTVTVAGQTIEVDALGFRDHSRGIRKFESRSGHTLLSGSFPSGFAVGLYEVRALDGRPNFSQAFTVRDGIPHDAVPIKVPHYTKPAVPGDWIVVLRDDLGEEIVIEGSPVGSVPMTTLAPNDLINGLNGDPDGYSVLLSPSVIRCRGEQGAGHLELSMLNKLA
jgi:hypothetical protein